MSLPALEGFIAHHVDMVGDIWNEGVCRLMSFDLPKDGGRECDTQ